MTPTRSAWLDNLVPIRAHLGPHQLADWRTPPPPAEQGLGYRLRADVRIPMADGTHLSADVYTPKVGGRYPAIVQFSQYNRDLHTAAVPRGNNEIGSPTVIADRGYVQIVVTARGVGRSEGELQPWYCEREIDDLEQCIAWAAEQPFANGAVAMFGTSYYAMIQLNVALRRPPALRALFANEVCTDYRRHIMQYGGNFNAFFLSLWAGANFTHAELRRSVPPVVRALASQLLARPWAFARLRPRLDAVMAGFTQRRGVAPEVLRWLVAYLAQEEERLEQPPSIGPTRDLARIDVPFVVAQNRGLVALHQFGAYELFERAGTPIDQRYLIVGPAEYTLPVTDWQLEALAFFDRYVKGFDNGYERQARVRYYRDEHLGWGRAASFPAPDSRPLRLYPASDTTLAEHVPDDGVVSHWLALPAGLRVLPELGETVPEQRTYAWTAPRPLELFGPVTLSLRYSCTEIDSYIVARLDRVDATGARTPLCFAHRRPAVRAPLEGAGSAAEVAIDPRSREPLRPNEAIDLRFSMTPAVASLETGDRLELTIASRPERVHVPVREGFVLPEAPVPYFARNTLHLGAGTSIELTTRPR
jgi:predicted acyl esterase